MNVIYLNDLFDLGMEERERGHNSKVSDIPIYYTISFISYSLLQLFYLATL